VFVFRATLIAAVVVAALALPAMAAAQGSDATAAEYKATDKLVVGAAGGGGGGGGPEQPTGLESRVVSSLPFTGFDLVAMGLAAIVITGTGFALRRLSSAPRLDG
jgi:hypothetical protein